MRVLYMGTPDFAVPTLQAMIEAGHEVVAVITQPDRPRGRGKKNTAPPVKVAAQAMNIPVLQPENVKAPEFIATLQQLAPEIISCSRLRTHPLPPAFPESP